LEWNVRLDKIKGAIYSFYFVCAKIERFTWKFEEFEDECPELLWQGM